MKATLKFVFDDNGNVETNIETDKSGKGFVTTKDIVSVQAAKLLQSLCEDILSGNTFPQMLGALSSPLDDEDE